jgi:hypothetical protein
MDFGSCCGMGHHLKAYLTEEGGARRTGISRREFCSSG